jgi:uncharacterized membrane protein (UPF0127 family)
MNGLMLYNKTLKKKIGLKVVQADSFFKRLKGLMFKRGFDYALLFEFAGESRAKASIHMLFVFTPIDIAYLDKEKTVVDLKASLQPWTLNYTPKRPARFLLELPPGSIKKFKLEIGQKIDWP